MARIITIIQGHPDPAGGHLCHALADAYAAGARDAGHQVNRIDIASADFPLLRSKADFEAAPLPAGLVDARDAIAAAQHIVLIFPLWLGTMPALVKAFLEQIMRPGLGFEYQRRGFPKKLLKGRSARIVVTMGMPAMLYRWFYFSHALRSLKRNIFNFVGISPVRQSLFGMVEGAGEVRIQGWLKTMHQLGAEGR